MSDWSGGLRLPIKPPTATPNSLGYSALSRSFLLMPVLDDKSPSEVKYTQEGMNTLKIFRFGFAQFVEDLRVILVLVKNSLESLGVCDMNKFSYKDQSWRVRENPNHNSNPSRWPQAQHPTVKIHQGATRVLPCRSTVFFTRLTEVLTVSWIKIWRGEGSTFGQKLWWLCLVGQHCGPNGFNRVKIV